MFAAISSETLADGTTLAHYCPADMPGGYVAFRDNGCRLRVRAVLVCLDSSQRVTWHHWHKSAPRPIVSQDFISDID